MSGELITMIGSGVLLVAGILLRISRRVGPGPWDVLQELARGRAITSAERERRATTVQVLDKLAAGGRVAITDPLGRRTTYDVAPPTRTGHHSPRGGHR